MVAIKANQVEAALKRLSPELQVFVIYGTDTGRVSETAAKIACIVAGRSDPPGEILRIEDTDLEDNPDRLLVELQTLPMFGGAKTIRTTIGRRINSAMLKPILEGNPPASCLVIEAGNLKPSDALRKLSEPLSWAAALPCYADTARDVSGLIDTVISDAGLTITPAAKALLTERIGADRALSRNEIEKLTIYAAGSETITEEDVDAIIGDASLVSLDRVTLAVIAGQTREALGAAAQARAAGQANQAILLALQRQLLMLHRLGAQMANGKSLEDAARGLRPPLHFAIKDKVASAMRHWRFEALRAAVQRTQGVIRDTRSTTPIEDAITERLILELCQLARAPKPR